MVDKQRFMALKSEFYSTFAWRSVSYEGFKSWVNQREDVDEQDKLNKHHRHFWAPMKRGEPVPYWFILLFSEYVSARFGAVRPASQIAQEADRSDSDTPNPRTLGWHALFEYYTPRDILLDENYPQGDRDFELAAEIVMEAVGQNAAKDLPSDVAIASGVRIMGRESVSDLAEYFRVLNRVNERIVLFAVWKERGEVRRVGVSSVIPLTESFYRDFREGKHDDIDIGVEHVSFPTDYLYLHAVADYVPEGLDKRASPNARKMCQSRTLNWQMASFLHSLPDEAQPSYITIAGTEENKKLLQTYCFVELGTKGRVTGMPIMEFGPPPQTAFGYYWAMKGMLALFQIPIKIQRVLGE